MPLKNTPLGFGFPTATPHGLTSRHAADSQAHSSKGTPSHTHGALTDCKHMVSGTISLPSRGTFHHSLTVLIHYRSQASYQTYRTVPADSQQIPRARCYSGNPTTHMPLSSTTGLSPSPAGHSKPLHLTTTHEHDDGSHRQLGPTTPHTQPLPGITCTRFSLIHVRSPLLAESLLFSPPTGTEMFHFPA